MAQEQSVRVTAKGDFSQLLRGLKQLQGDLRNVTGEIDRGARKGGFFDESQLRALDFFGKRFKSTLQEMKDALQEHGHAYERLLSQSRQAHGAEKEAFEKEIKNRAKTIDQIEEQIASMERLYRQRKKEADDFDDKPSGGSGGGGSSGGGRASSDSGLLTGLMGAGKFMLGMAGIGGIAALAHQAYSLAKEREVNSLDLAQRMRGRSGWKGSATNMYDRASGIGTSDNMGYGAAETWQFLDSYSRMAGTMGGEQTGGLLKFGRAYGLQSSEVAGAVGGNRAMGGTSTPKAFADAIAGSVESSGMTPRILEVMDTNNTLLEQMNTTLKDGSAQQILAYQTTLDRIGMAKGMMQLTGKQGANLIGGLGGIFGSEQGNDWKWTGIRALQQYDPKKYGKMGLFGLESSFEDGLMNEDNVPAMAKLIKSQSGGNKDLEKRIFQKWMADGGQQMSKREISEMYDATGGLTAFSEENMKKLKGGSIDSGGKYDERKDATGQDILSVDARFEIAMAKIGAPIVEAINALKGGITTGAESIAEGMGGIMDGANGVVDFLKEHWKELATVAGVGIVASNVLKVVGAVGLAKFGSDKAGIAKLLPFLLRLGLPAAATWAIFNDEKAGSLLDDGMSRLVTGNTVEENVARQRATEESLKKTDPVAYEEYMKAKRIVPKDLSWGQDFHDNLIPSQHIAEGLSDATNWLIHSWNGKPTPSSSTSSGSSVPMQAGNFFPGWQDRVTGTFGEDRGDHKHKGLDINGEQGDVLDALAGGKITKLTYDDGSKLDKDGKMNTNEGGTEMVVKMPNGKYYSYSHMSNVNSNLKVGSEVSAGDWLGNVGGDRDKAGSGSSTTGSHLHLGYYSKAGTALDPVELLKGLDKGDSSLGTSGNPLQKTEINVKLDVSGEGAKQLNNSTKAQLEALVKRIMAENERLKLSVQPSKMGWNL